MSSSKPSILIQLDTDSQPSVFDGVVAVDSGVDFLFRHSGVTPENAPDLVYGALFTRGADDLNRSAIFIGGSDVAAAEAVLAAVKQAFFHTFRVSVLFDANGSNTTAAAAVLAAIEGIGGELAGVPTAVLGATGPVGRRVARLLSYLGATVAVGSRSLDRAEALASSLHETHGGVFTPFSTSDAETTSQGLSGAAVVVAAGAAGVTLLTASSRAELKGLKVAIDLNAVPPTGIEGIKPTDKGTSLDGARVWGALGVGGTKMKIHKRAIQDLFKSNDKIFDAEEILAIGRSLTSLNP